MKDQKNTVIMSGEKIVILVDAACLTGCRAPEAAKLPALVSGLCQTLASRNVARYFIHNVRIGETVTLVDKKVGHTFRLKMEAHTVVILSISKHLPKLQENRMPVLFVVNSRILQAISNKAVAA